MGLTEFITHKEEIDDLLNDAQEKYDNAQKRFNEQKDKTTKQLENLGKIKVDCWSGNMESFLNVFNSFKNVDVESKLLTESNFKGKDESFELIISNSENAIFTAKEIKDTGIAAIGTGALVGIASYGGAMMFAKASTGTAIKTLSGAAKKNATLAFFGGGSKALGGLGVKGGKFVLAGIVVTPILLVAGAITAARSKAKLAEAKKINAEAIDACEKMNVFSTGMSGIENISKNYCTFIGNFNNIFNPIINKIQLIKDKYIVSENEKIDFNEITKTEQKTIHIGWLLAQIYYHLLSTPILNDNGELDIRANEILENSQKELQQMKEDSLKDNNDYASILWEKDIKIQKKKNYIATGVFIALAVLNLRLRFIKSILFGILAFIVYPNTFMKNKNSESQNMKLRKIKLVVSIILSLIFISM